MNKKCFIKKATEHFQIFWNGSNSSLNNPWRGDMQIKFCPTLDIYQNLVKDKITDFSRLPVSCNQMHRDANYLKK